MFGQSRAKVSIGFANVSSLAYAAFDLVYCCLFILQFVFVLDIIVSSRRKEVIGCVQHVYCKVVVYVR